MLDRERVDLGKEAPVGVILMPALKGLLVTVVTGYTIDNATVGRI